MRLVVCSQTPPISLTRDIDESNTVYDVSYLKEKVDYIYSISGLARMVYAFLRQMIRNGFLENASWVSLNPRGPRILKIDGVELIGIKVDDNSLKSYSFIKELLWWFFHGAPEWVPISLSELIWLDDFAYYNLYNRVCSETLAELDKEKDFDLFYVHDFQQIPTGYMLETLKPKVFRWHIPFDEKIIPAECVPFLKKYFDAYDAIIVSTRSQLESLKKIGYIGNACHIYPYIDFSEYVTPSPGKVSEFCERFSIKEDDIVIAIVARLDPLKGHDIALKALARVIKRFSNVKLLIVGGESFSSSRRGLGLSKAKLWRQHLMRLVDVLNLHQNVIFTGYVNQEELGAVYSRADFTMLPSRAEGFGLVVAESWLYRKPVIVSRAAGIAEIAEDGSTGFVVDPHNLDEIEEAMLKLISDEKLRSEMSARCREAAELCSIERGLKEEVRLFNKLLEGEDG